jgi:glycosyltransferase involved in cell wall biosynthesis
MRALVIGDRRFVQVPDGTWYTEGPMGPETGERYLRWFDSLTVVGRGGTLKGRDLKSLNKICSPGLDVQILPDLSGLVARVINIKRTSSILRSLINEHDAVIARMPTQLGGLALRLGIEMRKSVAVDMGGCSLDGLRAYGTIKARIYAPIAFYRVRKAIVKVHWASYVTQHYLQARYPAAPGARSIACSNVDIPPPDPVVLQKRLECQKRGPSPIVFGTIGSLYGKFKGVQHALAALAAVSPRLPKFEYRILGGGDQRPWRELANKYGLAENVFFDGTLPAGKPCLNWLDQIDVYLHPSLREGVPRALIEAMSRGCPAIASDIAGIPELLPSEVLHGAGNIKRLGELIESSIKPEFMKRNALRNWERAKDFSVDRLNVIRDDFWTAFVAEASVRKSASRKEWLG